MGVNIPCVEKFDPSSEPSVVGAKWVGWLVSWCFEPSQPQRVISGLSGVQNGTDRKRVKTYIYI